MEKALPPASMATKTADEYIILYGWKKKGGESQ